MHHNSQNVNNNCYEKIRKVFRLYRKFRYFFYSYFQVKNEFLNRYITIFFMILQSISKMILADEIKWYIMLVMKGDRNK